MSDLTPYQKLVFERYLARKNTESEEPKPEEKPDTKPKRTRKPKASVAKSQGFNLSDYLILDSRTHGTYSYPDLLVAKERSKFGKNWIDTQTELHNEGSYMLTIRQFVDFLTMLQSCKVYDGAGSQLRSQEVTKLLNDIIEVRDPWRSEHLDAKFNKAGDKFNITYHKIKQNGTLEEVTESLEDCLMTDKQPGIDLSSWLTNGTTQGLPKKDTSNGSIWYWSPRDDAVAGFDADAGRAVLVCDWDPDGANGSLGVRIVRKKS
jgi:hypothetical protein